MSGHLDLDALADALADAGADRRGAGRRHLADCSACASRLEELRAGEAAVIASLAALPDPVVPPGLSERIAAALSSESPRERRAPTAVAGTHGAPAGSTRIATVVPRGRPATWLPAAAAVVLLLGGAGLGIALLAGGGGSDNTTASIGAAAAPPESSAGGTSPAVPTSATGTDYATKAAVTAALPGVLAAAPRAMYASSGPADQPLTAPAAASPASRGGQSASKDSAMAIDPALDRLREPKALESCLSALLAPEQPLQLPLALDYADYAGRPALAVVLPDPDPGKVAVFVVGPACSRDDDQTLFFTRLDRPS